MYNDSLILIIHFKCTKFNSIVTSEIKFSTYFTHITPAIWERILTKSNAYIFVMPDKIS